MTFAVRFKIVLLAALTLALAALIPMCALTPAHAGDNVTAKPSGSGAPEICFPLPAGESILHEVETGRAAIAEADACKAWQEQHAVSDQVREDACAATAQRLEEVTAERDEAIQQAASNIETGEAAAKLAGGSIWSRIKTRATWAGIGAAALAIALVLL